MVIYADIVFVENLIINFIILYVTALLKKIKISYFRIILASACGSLYAILAIRINNVFYKLILSILMVIIVCPTKNMRKILETLTVFYLVSITTGGASIAISYLFNGYDINTLKGITVVNFPIIISAIGVTIGIFLIMLTINNVKSKISKNNIIYDVEIFFGTRKAKIKALLDTGNMLKDPITNRSVIVVAKRSLQSILSREILDDITLILGGDKIGNLLNEELVSRIKLIPFNSLGNEHGILVGIKSDKIIVDDMEIKDVIIGIYEKEFSRTKRYDALIGIDLLYEEECNYELDRKNKKQYKYNLCKILKSK